MANDSSNLSTNDVKSGADVSPKMTTIKFIRQFARTCATVHGCALGSMILN